MLKSSLDKLGRLSAQRDDLLLALATLETGSPVSILGTRIQFGINTLPYQFVVEHIKFSITQLEKEIESFLISIRLVGSDQFKYIGSACENFNSSVCQQLSCISCEHKRIVISDNSKK